MSEMTFTACGFQLLCAKEMHRVSVVHVSVEIIKMES